MEKFSSQLMFELTTEEKNDYFLQKFDYKDVTTESLMLILQLCYPKSRVTRNPCKTSTHNNPVGKACSNSAVKAHKQGC